jgi:peptide/nickel transport system permease protein
VATYVLRRLLLAIPILVGCSRSRSSCSTSSAGTPSTGGRQERDAPKLRDKRHELGLDRPLATRYLEFMRDAITFDFGDSWKTKRPVGEMMADGVGPSLSLAVPAFLLEVLLAVSLALLCAYHRGSLLDRTVVVLSVAAMSIPSLTYILLGQKVLAADWKLFPVFGFEPLPHGFPLLVLPMIIWIALTLGGELRFYRAVMLEEMQDHVRTAAAKGSAPADPVPARAQERHDPGDHARRDDAPSCSWAPSCSSSSSASRPGA